MVLHQIHQKTEGFQILMWVKFGQKFQTEVEGTGPETARCAMITLFLERGELCCLFLEDEGQQMLAQLLFLKQANEMKLDKSRKFAMAVAAKLSCLLQTKEQGTILCLVKGEHKHPYSAPNWVTCQPGLQHLRKLLSKVVHAASP